MLGSYIKQNMRFFVAKVNLKEQAKLGFTYLRPLQVSYESPKFMLPIRLGTVNADGPQELFVYALTRKGRVETTNYRTVKLPTGMDVPPSREGRVRRLLQGHVRRAGAEGGHARGLPRVRLGHGLVRSLRGRPALARRSCAKLGVVLARRSRSRPAAGARGRRPMPPGGGAQNVFVTRLHVRYDAAHFPEDLVFQETADRENFQGRYVLRHPWTGRRSARQADGRTAASWPQRREQEAQTLARSPAGTSGPIRKRMGLGAPGVDEIFAVRGARPGGAGSGGSSDHGTEDHSHRGFRFLMIGEICCPQAELGPTSLSYDPRAQEGSIHESEVPGRVGRRVQAPAGEASW